MQVIFNDADYDRRKPETASTEEFIHNAVSILGYNCVIMLLLKDHHVFLKQDLNNICHRRLVLKMNNLFSSDLLPNIGEARYRKRCCFALLVMHGLQKRLTLWKV